VTSIVDWLRAGYPEEAPTTGYSPLLALNGPISLTDRQTELVLRELCDGPASTIQVDVAITKVTNRLPTPNQRQAIHRLVQQRKTHPLPSARGSNIGLTS
jgi:Protein of unknown function (DUF3349)